MGDKVQYGYTPSLTQGIQTMSDLTDFFGEPISSYSRAQAIEDGVLVDLSGVPSIKRTFKYPFACTAEVFGPIEQEVIKGGDLTAICHDIAMLAILAIRRAPQDGEPVHFKVRVGNRTHDYKLHIGPGDTPSPVLTLMFPNQD
jgi:hypothetical protein